MGRGEGPPRCGLFLRLSSLCGGGEGASRIRQRPIYPFPWGCPLTMRSQSWKWFSSAGSLFTGGETATFPGALIQNWGYIDRTRAAVWPPGLAPFHQQRQRDQLRSTCPLPPGPLPALAWHRQQGTATLRPGWSRSIHLESLPGQTPSSLSTPQGESRTPRQAVHQLFLLGQGVHSTQEQW